MPWLDRGADHRPSKERAPWGAPPRPQPRPVPCPRTSNSAHPLAAGSLPGMPRGSVRMLGDEARVVARVFLSVGSNLGDRLEHLRRAVAELRSLSDVAFVDASSLYRTEPWESGRGQQPDEDSWFFNCVVSIDTALRRARAARAPPADRGATGPPAARGTPEDRRYEPRPLDIDILLYGDEVISGPMISTFPILMRERAFVLRPLADAGAGGASTRSSTARSAICWRTGRRARLSAWTIRAAGST